MLHKCDVWSFGLLAWEVLLGGDYYRNHLSQESGSSVSDPSSSSFNHRALLPLAIKSITRTTNPLQKPLLQALFTCTLQVDPIARLSDWNKLAIMSIWHMSGRTNLDAILALHSGTSEWSYDIFRPDHDGTILWEHQRHIYSDFTRAYDAAKKDQNLAATAAWQVACCHGTGFGTCRDERKAIEFVQKAREVGHPVAARFGELLEAAAGMAGCNSIGRQSYTELVCQGFELAAISQQCTFIVSGNGPSFPLDGSDKLHHWVEKLLENGGDLTDQRITIEGTGLRNVSVMECAISLRDLHLTRRLCSRFDPKSYQYTEPLLILACRSRSITIVNYLLQRGLDPNEQARDGRSMLHWLFMLGDVVELLDHSLLATARPSVEIAAKAVKYLHKQWPLRLLGTPLSHAIASNNVHAVRILLRMGARPLALVHTPEQYGDDQRSLWTGVHLAMQYNAVEILTEFVGYVSVIPPPDIPFACALSFGSMFERMAVNGPEWRGQMMQCLSVLGPEHLLQHAKDGRTALMQALDFGDMPVITTLIQGHPPLTVRRFVDPANHRCFTFPLHFAAQLATRRDDLQSLDVPKLLHKHNSDLLFALDSDRRTPLHLAASGYSKIALEWILDSSPSLLTAKDGQGKTALEYCVAEVTSNALLDRGSDINNEDSTGMMPIHHAALGGAGHIVRLLLTRGAKLDSSSGMFGSPLHCAVIKGSRDITKMLLEFKAPINARDRSLNTPLHIAIQSSRADLVQILLDYGAEVNTRNANDDLPLHAAIKHQSISAVRLLLSLPGDLDGNGMLHLNGDSVFHLCASTGNVEIMKLLLTSYGKTPLPRNLQERSPLHVAALHAYTGTARVLLEFGEDVDGRDNKHQTPLHLLMGWKRRDDVLLQGNPDGFCLLLNSHKCALDARNLSGKTPWDIALQNRDVGLRALLFKIGGTRHCRISQPGTVVWLQVLAELSVAQESALLLTLLRAQIFLERLSIDRKQLLRELSKEWTKYKSEKHMPRAFSRIRGELSTRGYPWYKDWLELQPTLLTAVLENIERVHKWKISDDPVMRRCLVSGLELDPKSSDPKVLQWCDTESFVEIDALRLTKNLISDLEDLGPNKVPGDGIWLI